MSELKDVPQTQPGAPAGGGTPPPAPPVPSPGGGSTADQTRRMLMLGVIGFLILVFLLVVAFGGQKSPVGPVTAQMPDLTGKGLQYATDQMDSSKDWGEVTPYDATGQDRSLRDRRDWQVCFQSPSAGEEVDDQAELKKAVDTQDHREKGAVWLGVVRTNESCARLRGDYGKVDRVYDRGPAEGEQGTDVVPDLTGFTAHMARVAFGDDASIRVTRIPTKAEQKKSPASAVVDLIKEQIGRDKAIKADNSDEVGSGWSSWTVCPGQIPAAGTAWGGKVIELRVVKVNDSCTNPKNP